jgi:hypothetical protein
MEVSPSVGRSATFDVVDVVRVHRSVTYPVKTRSPPRVSDPQLFSAIIFDYAATLNLRIRGKCSRARIETTRPALMRRGW